MCQCLCNDSVNKNKTQLTILYFIRVRTVLRISGMWVSWSVGKEINNFGDVEVEEKFEYLSDEVSCVMSM